MPGTVAEWKPGDPLYVADDDINALCCMACGYIEPGHLRFRQCPACYTPVREIEPSSYAVLNHDASLRDNEDWSVAEDGAPIKVQVTLKKGKFVNTITGVVCKNCHQHVRVRVGRWTYYGIGDYILATCPYRPFGPHQKRNAAKARKYKHAPIKLEVSE